MFYYGEKSEAQLVTLHEDLQAILNVLINYYDFSILEGLRSEERQNMLFKQGRSKLDGINKKSKHQGEIDKNGDLVSFAVDIMPYHKGTNAFSNSVKDNARFYMMMGMVFAIADDLYQNNIIDHKVRFGLDWDMDQTFTDQTFDDLPHFELVRP